MLVNALHAALEDREIALNRIRGDGPANVFHITTTISPAQISVAAKAAIAIHLVKKLGWPPRDLEECRRLNCCGIMW
jgi:hypothetical protein